MLRAIKICLTSFLLLAIQNRVYCHETERERLTVLKRFPVRRTLVQLSETR